LLERFLELVEGVHMLHCGGERSISYEVSQLLINLFDLSQDSHLPAAKNSSSSFAFGEWIRE
jgi:hypothetical protein